MAGLNMDGEIDLERLGLPVTNKENKKLEVEVQEKEKEIALHLIKVEEHEERIQAITEHSKNVKQELQHTQVRLTTDCSPTIEVLLAFFHHMPGALLLGDYGQVAFKYGIIAIKK